MKSVEQHFDWAPQFGVVIQNGGRSAVCISSYRTEYFTVCLSGPRPAVKHSCTRFNAGVLIFFQEIDEHLKDGMFVSMDKDQFRATERKATFVNPEENPEPVQRLLRQAVEVLQSGKQQFVVRNTEACSPVPNFMQKSEWPKIIELIGAWLAANSDGS